MAEFLVKAQEPWRTTNFGSRKGDIIVVRPDGWKWGRAECQPNYVIVKCPELKYEEAKEYERPLVDGDVVLKKKKYCVDLSIISGCEQDGGSKMYSKASLQIREKRADTT